MILLNLGDGRGQRLAAITEVCPAGTGHLDSAEVMLFHHGTLSLSYCQFLLVKGIDRSFLIRGNHSSTACEIVNEETRAVCIFLEGDLKLLL